MRSVLRICRLVAGPETLEPAGRTVFRDDPADDAGLCMFRQERLDRHAADRLLYGCPGAAVRSAGRGRTPGSFGPNCISVPGVGGACQGPGCVAPGGGNLRALLVAR